MEERISLDDLRHILFAVENQEMTVRELRTALFNSFVAGIKWDKKDLRLALKDITRKAGD